MNTVIKRTLRLDRCDLDSRQWAFADAVYDRSANRDHVYLEFERGGRWPNIWPLPVEDLRVGLVSHVHNADSHGSAWTVEPVADTDGTTRIRIETGDRSAEYEVATDALRRLLDDIAAARSYRTPQPIGDAA